MRDPNRLLSRGATEFERTLLQAVKAERPTPELRLRMEQALGFTGAGAAAPVAVVAKAWHASWLKLGAGGLVAGGLVASGLVPWWLTGAAHHAAPGPAATEVTSPLPAVALDPARDPHGAVSAVNPAAKFDRAKFDRTTLRDEIELLDAVRAEVSVGRTVEARRALVRYERRFPAGALQREAQVLGSRIGGAAPARRAEPGAASRR